MAKLSGIPATGHRLGQFGTNSVLPPYPKGMSVAFLLLSATLSPAEGEQRQAGERPIFCPNYAPSSQFSRYCSVGHEVNLRTGQACSVRPDSCIRSDVVVVCCRIVF